MRIQPSINGVVTISKIGLITKKAIISFWYQSGELPKKLFLNALANVAVIFLSFITKNLQAKWRLLSNSGAQKLLDVIQYFEKAQTLAVLPLFCNQKTLR